MISPSILWTDRKPNEHVRKASAVAERVVYISLSGRGFSSCSEHRGYRETLVYQHHCPTPRHRLVYHFSPNYCWLPTLLSPTFSKMRDLSVSHSSYVDFVVARVWSFPVLLPPWLLPSIRPAEAGCLPHLKCVYGHRCTQQIGNLYLVVLHLRAELYFPNDSDAAQDVIRRTTQLRTNSKFLVTSL